MIYCKIMGFYTEYSLDMLSSLQSNTKGRDFLVFVLYNRKLKGSWKVTL